MPFAQNATRATYDVGDRQFIIATERRPAPLSGIANGLGCPPKAEQLVLRLLFPRTTIESEVIQRK